MGNTHTCAGTRAVSQSLPHFAAYTPTQGSAGQCRAGINTVLSGPSGDRAILRVSICTKEGVDGEGKESGDECVCVCMCVPVRVCELERESGRKRVSIVV